MSIMRNPVVLAMLVALIVFVVLYYYYNYYVKNEKGSSINKKIKKKEKKEMIINETMIISAAFAGLVTWYIVTNYFSQNTNSDVTDEQNLLGFDNDIDVNKLNIQEMEAGTSNKHNKISNKIDNTIVKIPRLDTEDSTRSYNLIGSGVNIPRSDLKIPSVLIDYK